VPLLRELQRRQHRRPGVRIPRAHLLHVVVERLAHRSTSPITGSSDAATAIRSAIAVPRTHVAVGLKGGEARRPELDAPRLRAAVRDEVAAALAARRLDRDVHLSLGDAVALGDDLEVVDERLHRGVELLARRQHDLAVVRDPRLPAQLLEPRDALGDDARRRAHLVHVTL
jgi:hypothetical protein